MSSKVILARFSRIDADAETAGHAAAALGHLRDRRALSSLIDLTEDARERVKLTAVASLTPEEKSKVGTQKTKREILRCIIFAFCILTFDF